MLYSCISIAAYAYMLNVLDLVDTSRKLLVCSADASQTLAEMRLPGVHICVDSKRLKGTAL